MNEEQASTSQPGPDSTQPAAAEEQKAARKKSGGKRIFWLLLVLIGVAAAFAATLLQYVAPNEYGIKVVKIGVKRGVQEKVYSSGYHLVLPLGMEEMDRLPKDIQVLELTNHPQTAAREARVETAAHIQTSDGFYVDVDVSILYRIVDPYKVFTIIGPGDKYVENGIMPQAEPKLKDALGELTTEEFYNSPLRVQKTEKARELLNAELNPKGLNVEHVLVRYFIYSGEIQRNIEEKKLKDQLVLVNQAQARAAAEEAELKKILEEGEAAVAVELEKGRAHATRKKAEQEQYVRSKRAEGDLQVQLAEAEKVRLKNEALSGAGAENMVGLKMADVYRGLDVIVLPSDGSGGINPLDLDNTLRMFGVRKEGNR